MQLYEIYFMEINNIIEVCVPIVVGIIGVSYPIILDKISNIGDKYNSEYLYKVFDKEFFQKKVQNHSYFQIVLYNTLFSLVFLVFKFEPLFGWNNWFINNSAYIFVFCSTTLLIISFFKWSKLVMLYAGKISDLLKHLTKKYNTIKKDNERQNILKSINEITLYAIEKQDIRIEEDVLNFYMNTIISYRNEYKKSQKNDDNGIEYPYDFYDIINKLINIYIEKDKNKLVSLKDMVIRGEILIPIDYQYIKISETTYGWLWHYITLMSKKTEFIERFWAHSHQYFWTMLKKKLIDENKKERDERENERKRFLEFHYALGGLLLYSKNYEALDYIFTFTQQKPPKYELLPYNMNDIFEWFEWFSNENNHYRNPIGWAKYRFPSLDNLGNREQIVFSICKYISLLFIRQFKIPQTFLYYKNSTNQLQLPNANNKLYDWERSLEYFIICLNDVLKDDELLNKLNLKETYLNEFEKIDNFIINLKQDIPNRIKQNKLSAKLSDEKIKKYYNSSSEILENGFKQYEEIQNKNDFEETENDVKSYLIGERILSNKSSFVDNDIPCINYDSAFAYGIVRGILNNYIPKSFIMGRTKGYILNKEDLIKAFDIIIKNRDNIKIIAFNLEWDCNKILQESNYKDKIIQLPSTDMRNFVFLLEQKDLPKFTFKDIKEEEKQIYQLKEINKKYKIYGSIIDLNLPKNEELKKEHKNNISDNELKVLEILAFITEIRFRADRNIVQIKVNSLYEESGTPNTLEEIQSL